MNLTNLTEAALIRHGWTTEEIARYGYKVVRHYQDVQIEPDARVAEKTRWQQMMTAGLAAGREIFVDGLKLVDPEGTPATYARFYLRDAAGVGQMSIAEVFYVQQGERTADFLTVVDR